MRRKILYSRCLRFPIQFCGDLISYCIDSHISTVCTGRGGMASKINAAMSAVQPGSNCSACVVASGADLNSIRSVLGRNPKAMKTIGTLFVTPGSALEAQAIIDFPSGSVSFCILVGSVEWFIDIYQPKNAFLV